MKCPGTARILAGFSPWIVFWVLSGPAAAGAGLAAAAALNLWRFRRRNFKTLELITLGFFAAHFTFTFLLGSSFFLDYGPILSGITLAGTAWGTLLAGSPFTIQYAREGWDAEYWNDPLFLRINNIITAAWGAIFTFRTGLAGAVFLLPDTGAARGPAATALSVAALAGGVIFTARFPEWYLRRASGSHGGEKTDDQRDPDRKHSLAPADGPGVRFNKPSPSANRAGARNKGSSSHTNSGEAL